MSIQYKILDAYQLYLLSDKNIKETLKLTKITRPTLLKYIKLQECLDFEVLEYLDKKGKEKLTIAAALIFCDNVMNPEQQYGIFQGYLQSKTLDRITYIKENTECLICADSSNHFEFTPCCNTPICNKCFLKTMETTIKDLIFKPLCCPFCNKSMNLAFVRWFLKENKKSGDTWRNNSSYNDVLRFPMFKTNLYNRYMTILNKIEDKKDYYVTDSDPDYKSLLGDETYYGACSQCTPRVRKRDFRLIDRWNQVQVCEMPKACGNGEGGLLVLEPEMFRCVVCKSRDENVDDGEFKKCPHCGIKTVKPDGCNYIYCGDHRWCWICNERIEDNENGHNKHYWTGPGTSPYTNRCRVSVNSDQDKYVIKSKCECSACKDSGGAPLCRDIDCMNRCSPVHRGSGIEFNILCDNCM